MTFLGSILGDWVLGLLDELPANERIIKKSKAVA